MKSLRRGRMTERQRLALQARRLGPVKKTTTEERVELARVRAVKRHSLATQELFDAYIQEEGGVEAARASLKRPRSP